MSPIAQTQYSADSSHIHVPAVQGKTGTTAHYTAIYEPACSRLLLPSTQSHKHCWLVPLSNGRDDLRTSVGLPFDAKIDFTEFSFILSGSGLR